MTSNFNFSSIGRSPTTTYSYLFPRCVHWTIFCFFFKYFYFTPKFVSVLIYLLPFFKITTKNVYMYNMLFGHGKTIGHQMASFGQIKKSVNTPCRTPSLHVPIPNVGRFGWKINTRWLKNIADRVQCSEYIHIAMKIAYDESVSTLLFRMQFGIVKIKNLIFLYSCIIYI